MSIRSPLRTSVVIVKLLAACMALVVLSNHSAPPVDYGPDGPVVIPSLDLSAIRLLVCSNEDGDYIGSGVLVAPHTIATARHVSHGKCTDAETGTPVKAYNEDSGHDFALMSAPGIPNDIPLVKYRCDGLRANREYMSYGITDYNESRPILRMNILYSTREINRDDSAVEEFPHSAGMRVFKGAIAAGMSGGPVIDQQGYMVAVNNAGSDHDTLLFDLKDTPLCHKN